MTFPNLKYRRLFDSETGKWVNVHLSARVLRTVDKKGLSVTLRDLGMTIADIS